MSYLSLNVVAVARGPPSLWGAQPERVGLVEVDASIVAVDAAGHVTRSIIVVEAAISMRLCLHAPFISASDFTNCPCIREVVQQLALRERTAQEPRPIPGW